MNTSNNKFEIMPFDPVFADEMADTEALTLGEEGWSADGIKDTVSLNGTYFLAVKDGKYLGHGGFTTVLDECYITNIAVIPTERRQGIGAAIVSKMVDECKQKGAAFLSLEVRASNEPAVLLYKKYGFTECGRRKNFYSNPKEDAVIMTLNFR